MIATAAALTQGPRLGFRLTRNAADVSPIWLESGAVGVAPGCNDGAMECSAPGSSGMRLRAKETSSSLRLYQAGPGTQGRDQLFGGKQRRAPVFIVARYNGATVC